MYHVLMIELKNKIKENKLTIGSWITIGHSSIAEIMGQSQFDWLAIDLEHSSISMSQAEELIRVINLQDISPLVRLTSNNPDQIKRVMDMGAHGIIIPMVNSANDAYKAIEAAYYHPTGTRSFGLARAQGYGSNFENYLEWSKKNTVVIVQIEHINSIDHLDEIFSLDDVDAYIVGPYDLSGSMGIPGDFNNKDFKDAILSIKSAAKKANKPGGIHIVEPIPSLLVEAINDGFRFLAYGVDFTMINSACEQGLTKLDEKQ